jgi:2-polyprenyl-6-methoxyphenol hydroxylase-like FAD-dependent oxidoreductase
MKKNRAENGHAVVIAGGGPTGMMVAGELALAGVDVAIVERRECQDIEGLRAGGLHPRTIEVLDQRGIADRFVSAGQPIQFAPFAGTTLDISDLPSRHNYFLAIWQTHVERILADWVGELGVPIYRGREVTSFVQDNTGVDVVLSDARSLRAEYLIGCDGGRSLIRKKADIEFAGWDPTTSYLIAEVEMTQEPEWGIRRSEKGINAIAKLDGGKRARVVLNEHRFRRGDQPTLDDIREALIGLYGTDYGLVSAAYVSRFTDMARQAAVYRDKRVLVAGDAAHVHSPVGGQELNLGIQDAANLGWKLANVVHERSPESLLDTYHSERHPVGARVLRNTMALTALEHSDDRIGALREMLCELMRRGELRKQYFGMMSGLDIKYDVGNGHPLVGYRMPDLELTSVNGPLRVFALLHNARPVFLNLGKPGAFDITPWLDRVQSIDAKYGGTWELPVIGQVPSPDSVLIRPDGYVAWAGDKTQLGLTDALTTWFGPPAEARGVGMTGEPPN